MTDFVIEVATCLDAIGDELAGQIHNGADHACAFPPPLARRLHGGVDDRLRGSDARVGVVLLGYVLQKLCCQAFLAR